MPNDPGLAGDTCIFMEAVAGDGGVHHANALWWLSPDIELIGPVSGPDTADGGQVNTGKVGFHRKPAGSGCHFPGDESLTVELWVAIPSLVMAPRVRGSAVRIGFIGSPVPAEGDRGTQPIDWTPTPGLPADNALSPGRKCLVARTYPSSGTPSGTSFFVPDDPHVAQHNLVTLPCTGASMQPHGICTLTVATLNPAATPTNPLQKPQVKLRAVLDLAPLEFVRRTVLKRLQLVTGFQHLRTSPLSGGFRFDLSAFQTSNVVDHSHASVPGFPPPAHPPSFEATIVLAPRQVVQISFQADLTGTQVGEACLFHLIQLSTHDVVEGGLTLAMVRV
jgi:hypothetical protein